MTDSALDVQEGGDHYRKMKIQPVEFIHANGISFFEGSVIKYVSRWRSKGGINDLKKARHFIDLLIELETKEDLAEMCFPAQGSFELSPDSLLSPIANHGNQT